MAKYKVTKSDLMLNGKIILENSEVDLSKEQIEGLEDYLILLDSVKPKVNELNNKNQKRKIK